MNDEKEYVILVDENDTEVGIAPKLAAHRQGLLHRAISVYIFNSRGEFLLQERTRRKYHSGGLWTCTCCSHPRPGESNADAAHRRLREEMGFDCHLVETPSILYRADVPPDLVEHEFLHVFVGTYDGACIPNPEEADSFKWISLPALARDFKTHPDCYTAWFKLCFPDVRKQLSAYTKKRLDASGKVTGSQKASGLTAGTKPPF